MIQAIPPIATAFAAVAGFMATGAFVPTIAIAAATYVCSRVGLVLGGLGGGLVGGLGASALGAVFGGAAAGGEGAAAGAGVGLAGGGVTGLLVGSVIGALAGATGGYDFTKDYFVERAQAAPAVQEQPVERNDIQSFNGHEARPTFTMPKSSIA
jgi:hypothetical protein